MYSHIALMLHPFYVPNTGPISDECCSPIQPCLVAHRCLQVVGRPNVQLQENRLKNRDQETSSERATEGVAVGARGNITATVLWGWQALFGQWTAMPTIQTKPGEPPRQQEDECQIQNLPR